MRSGEVKRRTNETAIAVSLLIDGTGKADVMLVIGAVAIILGALILTVLGTMLTLLHIPEGGRRILFGLIVLGVTALFTRLTESG